MEVNTQNKSPESTRLTDVPRNERVVKFIRKTFFGE